MWGSESFGYIEAGLPEHYHNRGTMEISGGLYDSPNARADGAFTSKRMGIARAAANNNSGGSYFSTVSFNASRNWAGLTSSAKTSDDKPTGIYGNSATVQPPAVGLKVKTRFK